MVDAKNVPMMAETPPVTMPPVSVLHKGTRYKVVYEDKDLRVVSGTFVSEDATHIWILQDRDDYPTGIARSVIVKIEPQERGE